jgi:hypothetical protein
MARFLSLSALFLLAGCATAPLSQMQPLSTPLVCDAERDLSCDASGACAPVEAGVTLSVPVSISIPAGEGEGQFCIATGCHPARFARVPLNRTPNWAARVVSDANHEEGLLTLAPDRQSFQFTRHDAGAHTEWTGLCHPAGS